MSSTNKTKTYFLTKKQINSSIEDAISNLELDIDDKFASMQTQITSNTTQIENLGTSLDTKTTGVLNEAKSYTDSEIEDLTKELEELESKISGITTFDTQVVNELPPVGKAKVLYLIPEVDDDGNVLETKVEYIWVNDAWETIGTTRVSLKGYATEEYANRVADSAKTNAVSLANQYTDQKITDLKEGDIANAISDAKDYTDDKVDDVKESLNSYQTRDLTITDFDTEGVQATVEGVLRSNNQAIINNTSAINTITQEIVDIQQTKANRGELWFNGGLANVPNMSMNGSWSLCCRIRMQTSQARYASIFHLNPFYLYWNTRLCVLCSPVIPTAKQISVDDNNRLANGEWHSLVVSYDGTTLKLTDETGVLLSVATSEQISTSNRLLIGEVGYKGQIADVKYFNFDMSANDAPYTIADYIAGKDESPLLKLGNDFNFNLTRESIFTQRVPASNLTLTDSSTNIGYIRFEANATSSTAPYFWFPLGKTIKKGAKVEVSFDYKIIENYGFLNAGFGNQDSTTISDFFSSGTNTITLSNDCDCIVFRGGSGTTIQCDIRLSAMSAFTNGALLSLADYTIQLNNTTKVVLDESGNNNHATITGDVVGTKDNNAVIQLINENKTEITTSANTYTDTKISGLKLSTTYETIANVNTVKTNVSNVQASVSTIRSDLSSVQTTIGELEQDIESLKKTNSVSTYSGVYKSTSVEISNIYTNSSMVGVSGRIVVQPNLNNVAPIYIGENMTDITTAFPMYPDQIATFTFADINNFNIATDAISDGCHFVVEWGV